MLAAVPSQAQGLQWGFKGGVNMANISVEDGEELEDSRTGLALGGFVAIPFSPMFALQWEALYSMKGDADEEDGLEVEANLDYIEVPVLLKATFLPEGSARPFIYAGPAVAFNMNAEAELSGEDDTGEELSLEVDLDDQINSIDFGLAVGGGVEFPIMGGANAIGLEVRYTHGLMDINEAEGDEEDDFIDPETELKNSTLSFLASFGFL
jgi:hypothetical protein